MDPTVGVVVAAFFGLIGSVLAVRQALAQASTQATVAENTNDIELAKVQIEGWARFVESYRLENERLTQALTEERAIAEAFSAKADRLAAEVESLRDELNRRSSEEPRDPMA